MDRRLYTDEDAERFYKKAAGKPYQPSNGTEGDMFDRAWCSQCKRDAAFQADSDSSDGCPILSNTMVFDIDDPEYPKEWVYGPDGQPKCTAFEEVEPVKPSGPVANLSTNGRG